jgi:hypothetical protein
MPNSQHDPRAKKIKNNQKNKTNHTMASASQPSRPSLELANALKKQLATSIAAGNDRVSPASPAVLLIHRG